MSDDSSVRSPGQLSWRGWRQVLQRVYGQLSANNLGLVSAGVAFYGLLALFPGIAALITIYGLISDPAQVSEQFTAIEQIVPYQAYDLLQQQMQQVASSSNESLSLGLAGVILLALWSSTKGTSALIDALNIAYKEREERGFFRRTALVFLMTLGIVLLTVLVIALIVAVPVVLSMVGLESVAALAVKWLRWPVMAALLLFVLAGIYRYGPSRRQARWEWVSWGSGLAILFGLIASGLFSFYVTNFGNFNATYGSLGAVVVLLLWLFITAQLVILGGVLNAELEQQTSEDSTVGPDRPPGERGAYVADH